MHSHSFVIKEQQSWRLEFPSRNSTGCPFACLLSEILGGFLNFISFSSLRNLAQIDANLMLLRSLLTYSQEFVLSANGKCVKMRVRMLLESRIGWPAVVATCLSALSCAQSGPFLVQSEVQLSWNRDLHRRLPIFCKQVYSHSELRTQRIQIWISGDPQSPFVNMLSRVALRIDETREAVNKSCEEESNFLDCNLWILKWIFEHNKSRLSLILFP